MMSTRLDSRSMNILTEHWGTFGMPWARTTRAKSRAAPKEERPDGKCIVKVFEAKHLMESTTSGQERLKS